MYPPLGGTLLGLFLPFYGSSRGFVTFLTQSSHSQGPPKCFVLPLVVAVVAKILSKVVFWSSPGPAGPAGTLGIHPFTRNPNRFATKSQSVGLYPAPPLHLPLRIASEQVRNGVVGARFLTSTVIA